MYESSVKVPFIASQLGVIPEGLVSEAPVSAYDFMPALPVYAGAQCGGADGTNMDKKLPGKSFLPALPGQEFRQDERGPDSTVYLGSGLWGEGKACGKPGSDH